MQSYYNKNTRCLSQLPVGTHVLIQGKNKKWTKQGIIVEALKYRQYRIKVSGSGRATLRNRRFLRPFHAANPPTTPQQLRASTTSNHQQGTTIELNVSNNLNGQQQQTQTPAVAINSGSTPTPEVDVQSNRSTQHQPPDDAQSREAVHLPKTTPRALRNLATYNKPGLEEQPLRPEGRR